MVSAGMAIGFPGLDFNRKTDRSSRRKLGVNNYNFRYPRGGCTEAGLVIFDKGPFGKEPFSYPG
jgi:hypothetical protein